MTTVIDERVVEMRFNNADFEKNVAQSMSTLEKLKNSLNFDSAKSLEGIGKAAKGFSLSGITETITEATHQFSALEIAGITAISKITSAAMDMGAKFVKSLSVDQVTAGFEKYAEKTQAVQTIMAATAKDFSNTSEQMAYVNEQLDKLAWYTDETSYNFLDMAANIGKFTNNNVKLDTAVTAMQGIANWAAISGANSQEASRAMYNFSQALGAGAMKLQDWKSIENANMATWEFKQTVVDTAVQMGTLKKINDETFETLQGHTFTLSQFNTLLKDNWFTADVMMESLSKYGEFTNLLYDTYDAFEVFTTSEILDFIDDYKKGTLDLNEIQKETGYSTQELTALFDKLADKEYELGIKSFRAAQEAKTFMEAIAATKDAVSSQWMKTFEIIFGDYQEAKKLWTGVANALWDAFASGGERRNQVLKMWKDLGGRDGLIAGVIEMFNLAIKPINAVKQAFESMFPNRKEMANFLYDFTMKFKNFMESIQPSSELLNDIYYAFKGLFTIVKLGGQVFMTLLHAILPITKPFGSLIEMVIHFAGMLGKVIVVIDQYIQKNQLLQIAADLIATAFGKVIEIIKTLALVLGGAIVGAITVVIKLFSKIVEAIQKFVKWVGKGVTSVKDFVKNLKIIETIGNVINKIFYKIMDVIYGFTKKTDEAAKTVTVLKDKFLGTNTVVAQSGVVMKNATSEFKKAQTPLQIIINLFKSIGSVFTAGVLLIGTGIVTLLIKVKNFFTKIFNYFKELKEKSNNIGDFFKNLITDIFEWFGNLGEKIKEIFISIGEKIAEFFAQFGIDADKVKEVFTTITTKIGDFIKNLDVGKVTAILTAAALLSLVGAFIKLSDSFSTMASSIKSVFTGINKIISKQFYRSSVITDLAKSFAILAASLALLTQVNQAKLTHVAKIMGTLMIAFTGCAAVLKALDLAFAKINLEKKVPVVSGSILALAGAMVILSGAMFALSKIEITGGFKEWAAKLTIMAVLLAELTVAAIAISKLAPQIGLSAVLLLALAASMKVIVDTLAVISQLEVGQMEGALGKFAVLFVGLSAIIASAGQLKLTSALSLILVCKAIEMVFPQLVELAKLIKDANFGPIATAAELVIDAIKSFYHHLVDAFGEVGGTLAMLGTIAAGIGGIVATGFLLKTVKGLGILIGSIGVAFAGAGAGMLLVAKAVQTFAELSKTMSMEEIKNILHMFEGLALIIGGIIVFVQLMGVLSNVMGKKLLKWTDNLQVNFFAIAAAFVSIGAAMVLIAGATKIVSTIDKDKLIDVGIVMGIMLAALGIAAAGASLIQKGGPIIAGMIGIVTAVAVLMAEAAIVSLMFSGDKNAQMMQAFAGVGVVLGALTGICVILAKWGNVKLTTLGTILALVGSLVVIGVGLYQLKDLSWEQVLPALAGVTGTFIALTVAALALANFTKKLTLAKEGLIGGLIIMCIAALCSIGGMLYLLSGIAWQDMIAPFAALNLTMWSLVGVIAVLSNISKELTKAKTTLVGGLLLKSALALLMVGGALFLVAQVSWESMIGPFLMLNATMWSLVGVIAVIANISKSLTSQKTEAALAMILLCTLSLLGVGAALVLVSQVPWESMLGPFLMLNATMWSLVGVIAVLAIVAKGMSPLQGLLVGGLLAAGTAAIYFIAKALANLASINQADLDSAGMVLIKVMGVLGIVAAVLSFIGAAFGGAAGIAAVAAVLVAIGAAIAAMGVGMLAAAAGVALFSAAMEKLQNVKFDNIIKGLKGLCEVGAALGWAAPLIIAGSVALTALTVALAAFGIVAALFAPAIDKMIAATDKMKSQFKASFDGIKKDVEQFKSDLKKAFEDSAFGKLISKAGEKLGKLIGGKKTHSGGGGIIGGISESMEWNSPPGVILDLLGDVADALGNDGEVLRAAKETGMGWGEALGTAFGTSSMDMVGGIMNKILALFGKFQVLANTYDTDSASLKKYGRNKMDDLLGIDSTKAMKSRFSGGFGLDNLGDMLKNVGLDVSDFTLGVEGLSDALGIDGLTGAAEGATSAIEGTGGAAGKSSKSVKDFTEGIVDTIANSMDMFSEFSMKTDLTAEQLLSNMQSNLTGITQWSVNLASLAERGIDQALYQKLAEMGPSAYETVNAFCMMTDDQLASANNMWQQSMKLPAAAGAVIGAGFAVAGDDAVKGFTNALGQTKPASLQALELAKAALTALMGPEGLDEHSPSRKTFTAGENVVLGLRNGIQQKTPEAERGMETLTTAVLNKLKMTLTPLKFSEQGKSVITGLKNGMTSQEPIVVDAVRRLCESILNTFKEVLTYDAGYDIGKNFMAGLEKGVEDHKEGPLARARAVAEEIISTIKKAAEIESPSKVMAEVGKNIDAGLAKGMTEGVKTIASAGSKAVSAAQKGSRAILNTVENVLSVASPSKEAKWIGEMIDMGLAIGIEEGAGNVISATEMVSTSAINSMTDATSQISEVLSSGLDFNPIITPMLDLSYIKAQIEDLNNILNASPISVSGEVQNGGISSESGAAQINFTQNNYSPKALSRYEIYRQTKNQIAQLKGAMG